MNDFKKINLLGVGFTNASKQEILEFIYTGLQSSTKRYYIVTPNPELLVLANKDKNYKTVLNNAKLALADGVGVILASSFLGKPLKQRITGVDLTESLCNYVSKRPITVSFLGGGPKVAELTAECLHKKYPGLKVSWAAKEYDKSLKNKKTDILFVAFGSPKQEVWIARNLENLNVGVVIGVGGAFDFITGKVPRAPKFLQNLGLEWLFRLIIQPWRVKRQLSLIKFIILVLKEKITYN
ncbi:MAG: WecB/TagA/CpsF family glycosyltransferase [Candidatus Levybacteria bacterium]|nr:WecB/TagA/CpsF family glycosyltransferase [Candidatus Levybacteria bacterium]